MFKLY